MDNTKVVAVVGLGYVGLPLAVEFGKKRKTIGFDLSEAKVENYRRFIDPTGEVSEDDLRAANQLTVSTDPCTLSVVSHLGREPPVINGAPASSPNPAVQILRTRRGGHVGFLAGDLFRPRFWAEAQAVEFLARLIH